MTGPRESKGEPGFLLQEGGIGVGMPGCAPLVLISYH